MYLWILTCGSEQVGDFFQIGVKATFMACDSPLTVCYSIEGDKFVSLDVEVWPSEWVVDVFKIGVKGHFGARQPSKARMMFWHEPVKIMALPGINKDIHKVEKWRWVSHSQTKP